MFTVRDANNVTVQCPVTVGQSCCHLNCRDTSFCFGLPDSLIVLLPPTYTDTSQTAGGGTGPGGPATDCVFDSMWNNSPGVFPVGTTVVKWYVRDMNGNIDSCTQNVIRNPPTPYVISFTTSPPIVGGVINICNGQTITFTDNSTGTTGRLWNFGNGFYSSNQTHTEPAWHYPPGTYYDTLTVFDDCGNPHDTAFMVVVDSASGPDIFCISVVCPGDTVTYHTSANCTSYTWGVSGGAFYPAPPASTSDSATVIWGAGPNGTISLSVSGCTPPSTCNIATIKTVDIVPATLPIAGDTVVCAGSSSTYCVQCIPGNSHSWELLPANAGTITGNGTCCVTIQWAPGFFGIVQLQINYQNVLTGSGCNLPEGSCNEDPGCGGIGLITINVKPVFGISGPAKVCPGVVSAPFNGMNLTNNTIAPGTSWKLVTPSATVIPFANTTAFNAYTWNAGAGVYQLTAYAPPGVYCNDSAMTTVEVVQVLTPNVITGPDTVCAGQPYFYVTAPNMSGVTYTWNVTGGVLNPPINGSSVSVTWGPGGGTLSVYQTLTAAPGCVSNSTANYTVVTWPNFPLPVITASAPIACVKSSITYSIPPPLISNGTYTWSIVPATAGNIITANGLNFVTINWVSAATPPVVKLKISRCYEDSVMLPVSLIPLPPVPSISYAPLNPCLGDLVSFTTTSPGPIWNWSFGDANTSTLQNPTHTYASSGTFNIQLYVTNAAGCSDTAYTTITVDTVPIIPVITGPASVCLGSTVSYTFPQPLFNGGSYDWSLSAPALGNITGNTPNALTVKWNTPGVDTVRLHLQSTCIDTILRFVVTVNPLPTPGIGLPSPSCLGAPLTFTGTGGVNYNWSFSGGSPGSATVANPVVTYGSTGTYPLSLTVVDANGCTKSITSNVTINPLPLAVITGPYTVCSFPATVTMAAVNQAGYSFAWTPSGVTPSITQSVTGPTTFSVVVTNAFGCTQTSNAITVTAVPCPPPPPGCTITDTINFTSTPPVCLSTTFTKTGNATLYEWDFGDGGTAGNVSPVSHTYPIPGLYKVTVWGIGTGTDALGGVCIDTFPYSRIVTIPFDLSYTTSFACNGSGVMQAVFANTSLFVGSAASYNWNWYDVTTSTTIASTAFPGPITLSPGTHVITLSAFDPVTLATCSVTTTIVVPVPIAANFSVSSPVCKGSPALFTDLSVNIANEASRIFNNGDGASDILNPSSLIYANAPGPFTATLTVTDIYGCTSTASQSVSVLTPNAGSITVTPGTCDSVKLTASGLGPYVWQFISPAPVPDNPVYVKTSGFYKVTGTDNQGCPYTAGPVQVTVLKSPTVTITGQTNYCQGEALDIKTGAAGISFAWVRMPGNIPVGTNAPNLNIVPAGTGLQTYQVTVTGANGCTASASYTVFIDPIPSSAAIVASGPLTFCEGDSILLTVSPTGATYLWSKSPTPALTSPANTQPGLYVTVSGTYSVIVQTATGCPFPAIAPVTVTVNPKPVANITGDTVMCEGDQLVLQTPPVGGGTYLWNGPVATGTNNPFIVPNMQLTDAGLYTVVVTNSFGCTRSDSITVIVNPAPVTPVITSNPGGVLCEGQLFTFNATPIPAPLVVYTWSTGQIGTSITAAMQGDYYVTATNQFGCSAVSNILTIHPLPDLSCVPSGCYEFCNECPSVLIPGPFGFASYTWEMLVGPTFVFYSASQNLTVLPPGGDFRLIASNTWGCSDTSDTLNITFQDCCTPIVDVTECVDTTCQDFTNGLTNNFAPYILEPNVNVITNNVVGQYAGDIYIQATDQPGASAVIGDTVFDGKWCCGKFSYDFKVIDDGVSGSPNIQPQFKIWNSVANRGFLYTSTQIINENSPWKKVVACTSIDTFPLPNAGGIWTPIAPATIADWQSVASNVTEVIFVTEVSGGVGEVVGIDNVCFTPQTFVVACTTAVVNCKYTVGVNIVNNGACQNFQYVWDNGHTGPFIENAAPGTYCVKVISCCGCIDSCCVTVPFDSTVIVVTDTVYHINCDSIYGGMKVFVEGGVPPYSYLWSTGETTAEIRNLAAGAYNVIIEDSVGCETIIYDTVRVETDCGCNNIPPPPPPTITVISVIPDSCNSNGCINLTFTGCCLRYGYIYQSLCNPLLIDTVGPTLDSTIFCNLPAGTYTIIVKDPCGNTATQTVVVPSLVPPLLPFVSYSNCGAQICVGAEGGCGPYTYLWSNGETTRCITNFTPCVDLIVTITDANGCSVTMTVSPPTVTFDNIVQPTCCLANGSLCANVCFGQGPYIYQWSNGATTQCLTGVPAGTYCVTITNANGQQVTCCYTLTDGTVIPPDVHFDVLNCGAIVNAYINANGCPYTFHWQNGSTEPFFEQAQSCDSLTLTVIMCDSTEYYFGFKVPGVIPSITPVNCHTGVGSICVATECFKCPIVSYEWAPIIAGTPNNLACYNNVPSGIYTVCIEDSCGNRICCTIYLPPGDSTQVIHITDTVYNITCDSLFGGIDVEVAGGYPPFTYGWNTGATTQDIRNLVAGNYTLAITDSIGCITYVYDTVVVDNDCNCDSMTEQQWPTINIVSITPDSCRGDGCINATFTGCCLRYSYTYIHPCNPALSYSVPQTRDSTIFCNLAAGTYTIFVVDGCGNMVQQTVVVPSLATPLTALVTYTICGTGVCVVAQGGCGPYTYEWLGGATTECITLNNPCTSLYVTITDSRGCSITVYLTAPGISFTAVQPTCCQNNGSICVTACFGQGPLTYQWSNEATTECITNLAPGTYCVTITNALGQQVTCCYTLNAAPVIPPDVHFDVLNCGAVVNAYMQSNGCPFTYHWQNGSTEPFFEQAQACDSLTLTIVMCDGTEYYHGFRVPGVIPTLTPVDCHTGVGSICVATECFACPVVSYEWSPVIAGTPNDLACYSNIPTGIYTVCITDSCGNRVCCTIYLPPGDSAQIIHVTDTVYDITCDNLHGAIDVEVAGGYPPFTYSWNTGATTQDITNLVAGNYVLEITDSVGCITIVHDTVVVDNDCNCDDPATPLPTITVVSVEPAGCGGMGCINATFTGCCLWFSYTYIHPCDPMQSYSVAQTQDSTIFCNLQAGTYIMFIQDGCGNLVQQTVVVPSTVPPLTGLVTYSNCGTGVCVIAQGGCGPYTYEWLGGATTECIPLHNPCTSTYVTITDSRGCSVIVYFTAPGITFTNVVQPTCCQANGSLCVNVCFGEGPFTYQWSNEATTQCISNLAAGTYCVTITNGNGEQVTCCYTLTEAVVTPPVVHFNFNNCGSSVTPVFEGSNCETFTWYWDDQSTSLTRENLTACDSITFTVVACNGELTHYGFRVPAIIPTISPVNCATGMGGACVQVECFRCPVVSYNWTNLPQGVENGGPCIIAPPGVYTVCITNACGDVICCQVIIPDVVNTINVTATTINVPCFGGTNGSVTVSATGGTPPYSGTGTFNVGAGTYTYTVTDANGCSGSVTVTVTQPSPIVINYNATPINCYGGTSEVFISATGGTGPYQGTGFVILTAGTHQITVVDANGCVQTIVITITQPPKVEGTVTTTATNCIGATGTATVNPTGGFGPYTYLWSPGGQTTQTISNLAAGTYTCIITDSHGCTGTASGIVETSGSTPPTPGPITGPKGACRNTTGIVYSITPVPGATSYIWTLPSGATGSSTTTSISVSFGPTYAGGFICVSAVTPCGISAPSCMNIPVITTYAGVPIGISGPAIVCGPTTVTYTTSALNALGYFWTLTGGATIVSGQGTNTITVTIPAGFGQGSVQVYAFNCFGNSAVKGMLITGIPTHGYAVTGPSYVCANSSGTYSMPVVTGATSYVWTVSGDATLGTNTLSPLTTTQVINFGPSWTTGTVTVSAVNACGSFVKSFVVRSKPVQPGSISGPGNNLCNTSATYSIVAVAGATSYQWTVPPGVTIVGSSTGLSVNVVFGPTFTSASANICVSAINSCGSGPARCYTVTSRPAAPVISGPTTVCKSNSAVVYSIAPVAGATSYAWLVTGGATITPAPSGLSATVNYNTAVSSSAVVRANAINACGASSHALFNVSVSLFCRQGNSVIDGPSDFIAYPNPTTGKLTLSFNSESVKDCMVEIEDLVGKIMLIENVKLETGNNLHELDLSSYAKGMYFLSVKSDGTETKTIRIVIE